MHLQDRVFHRLGRIAERNIGRQIERHSDRRRLALMRDRDRRDTVVVHFATTDSGTSVPLLARTDRRSRVAMSRCKFGRTSRIT